MANAAASSTIAVTSTARGHQNKAATASSVAIAFTVLAHQNKIRALSSITVTSALNGGYTLFAGTAGTSTFLIRGDMPAFDVSPGDAATDPDGTILVDENANVLIWK